MPANLFATKGFVRAALAAAAMLAASTMSFAGGSVNTGYLGNVAILGYDPVAYFTEGRAIKGSPDITKQWLGTTWQFSSAQHRDDFASQPVRYAPQYGGFCALGVAIGEASANIDPEAWRIVDGKLYLFSGKEGLEEDFDADPGAVTAKADARWPDIESKEIAERAASN